MNPATVYMPSPRTRSAPAAGAEPAVSSNATSLVLAGLSVALLLLSSVDDGAFGIVIKLIWVLSVALLTVLDLGLAFGVYIFAVSLYSALFFEGLDFILQRPDNLALGLITAACLWRSFPRLGKWKRDAVVWSIMAFLLYAIARCVAGGASDYALSIFRRMYLLPFSFFLLMMMAALRTSELRNFKWMMAALGSYTGVVCIAERLDLAHLMLPPWLDLQRLNVSIGTGRSGGILMQPEWTGLSLGMIFALLIFDFPVKSHAARLFKRVAVALCVAGIFVTYTRAAWLAWLLVMGLWFWNICKKRQLFRREALFSRAVAAVVIVAVLLGFAVLPALVNRRIGDPENMYFRLNLWVAGLHMIADKPVFGFGVGQYAEQLSEYHEELGSIPFSSIGNEPAPAHNTLLTVGVELGIVGLLLYLNSVAQILGRAHSVDALLGRSRGSLVTALMMSYFVNVMFVSAHDLANNMLFYGCLSAIAGNSAVAALPIRRRAVKLVPVAAI